MFLKKLRLATTFLLSVPAIYAQVGINTTMPEAQLDIRSTNQAAPSNKDGLMIPKVDAFPVVNPTAAQQAMMVYLTTASGASLPGFYYWDNATTTWVSMSGGKDWDVKGNSGTTPGTNFMGTTDNQPLVVKTNNAEHLRVDPAGNVGIGTTTPQSKLHISNASSGMTPNPFSVVTIESNPSAYFSALSTGETGLLFGSNGNSTNGAIVYNNPGLADGMIFRTGGNNSRMIIGPTGNIGLGNFVPQYPFQFQSTLGDKICLWGGAGAHYGLGIQSSLLQIHTGTTLEDIAFGYGSSSAFTETMRIRGNGRVGIGTNAPNARIEVTASNAAAPANTDGMLIPRISAFPASNPAAAQDAMLVYLTTASGGKLPGFYYWDNATTTWKTIGGSGSPTNWGLTGNAGTTAATNFIGTTDNNDVIFKRNNLRAGLISTSNTSFGNSALNPAATGIRNTAFGNYAMRLDVDGHNNTAVGNNALEFNTSGFRNVAIGSNALVNNQTGGYSTAVGTSALMSNTTGGSNTAVGDYSLPNNTQGLFNVALGNSTLQANVDGSSNTAIGHRALFSNTSGGQSTAVGINSLYNNQAWGITGIGVEALASNTTGTYNTTTGGYSLHTNTTGTSNTANGYNCLYWNTGSYNTAMGVNAAVTNTSGQQNTAIGYQSLYANTTGNYVTALGMNALYSNQTASSLTAVGHNSLFSNTTGTNNNALGANALYKNTTGNNNTALGSSALYWSNGDNNTALGSNSLVTNLTGSDNTAIGKDALKATTASGAVAVGSQSLLSNVSGIYNTGVGTNSLRDNVTGGYNTGVGFNALVSNTGSYNTATGVNSLLFNNGGTYNTSAGFESMYYNTSGNWNTAFGVDAALTNTTGNDNVAVGGNALKLNSAGGQNVAVGVNAVLNNTVSGIVGVGTNAAMGNTSGLYNTAVGTNSLKANQTGSYNTASGYNALFNATGAYNTATGVNAMLSATSGSDNTSLGYQTLGNMTSGSGNTAVGSGALVTQTSGDNNIAIGKNAAVASTTGSNQLAIGNGIYGSGIDAAATTKIAVGKITPDAKVDIAASNAATPANTDGILIPRISAFPITNPTAAQNGMMVYLSAAAGLYPAGFYYWENTTSSWLAVGSKSSWGLSGNSGTAPATNGIGTNDSAALALKTNGSERMRISATGDVGIMTNNPTAELEVNGFTKLGSTAPAIKNLKLTGTTANTQGNTASIAHGLTSSKILSVAVLVEYTAGLSVPPSYDASAGYQYDYYISGTNIVIWNKTANSANILSKPVRVLVTYEE